MNELDPLAPDAPIHHLLSLRENPRVKDATVEQLQEIVKRIRTLIQSPQSMTAELQKESRKRKPLTAEQLKRKELLDSI